MSSDAQPPRVLNSTDLAVLWSASAHQPQINRASISLHAADECLEIAAALPEFAVFTATDWQQTFVRSSRALDSSVELARGKIYLVSTREDLSPLGHRLAVAAPSLSAWLAGLSCKVVTITIDGNARRWMQLIPLATSVRVSRDDRCAVLRIFNTAAGTHTYDAIQVGRDVLIYTPTATRRPMQATVQPRNATSLAELGATIQWAPLDAVPDCILEPGGLYSLPVSGPTQWRPSMCAEIVPTDPTSGRLRGECRLFIDGLISSAASLGIDQIIFPGTDMPFFLGDGAVLGELRWYSVPLSSPAVAAPTDEEYALSAAFCHSTPQWRRN